MFVNALVPRVLEAGQLERSSHEMRWALEDAWRNPLVLRCWKRVALQLDAGQAERAVIRASALHLGEHSAQATSFEQATDGWGIAQRGYTIVDAATAYPPPRRPRPTPRSLPAQSAINAGHGIADEATAPAQAFMFAGRGEHLVASSVGP